MSELPDIQRGPFMASMEAVAAPSANDSSHIGLMLIDVSSLSKINRTHGFETGDSVLATAHSRLLEVSKLPDTVFRIGGHSFAFILPSLGNPAFVSLAVNKVTTLLNGDIQCGDATVTADPKVGVAIARAGSVGAERMLVQAEQSLEKVKAGQAIEFEHLLSNDPSANQNDELTQRFGEALRNGGFELYYQPKVDLVSGRVKSAEALLRWLDDSGAPILAPQALVALADRSGKALELTSWVASACIRTLSRWGDELDIGLALNIQADLVGHRDLLTLLQDSKTIWGVEPERLTVEITEDAILDDQEVGFSNLSKLRDAGIQLSIDDFGTGYSSMSYFRQIPAAELKIDQSFVRSMLVDEQSFQLVKIMIEIGHQFGLQVVAEGVETQYCAHTLQELGCDYGQGYYFSAPLPLTDFEEWAKARNCSTK